MGKAKKGLETKVEKKKGWETHQFNASHGDGEREQSNNTFTAKKNLKKRLGIFDGSARRNKNSQK